MLALLVTLACQEAEPIGYGQTVTGQLTADLPALPTGEHYRFYAFEAEAGDRVEITLASDAFDPWLGLYGPEGFSEENDDERAGTTTSRLTLTLPQAGAYRIAVTSFAAGETGAYTLALHRLAGEVAAEGTPLAFDEPVLAALDEDLPTLSQGEYYAAYRFEGQRGERIDLRMESRDFDPYLILTGPEDFAMENDDAPSGGTDSAIQTALPHDGTYRVLATSLRGGQTGAYRLSLTRVPVSAVPLPIGASAEGALAGDDESTPRGGVADLYTFDGRRGQRVELALASDAFDPVLEIEGPGGFSDSNDDDPAGGLGSRLAIALPADGAYRIRVTSYAAEGRGPYTLTLAEAPAEARAMALRIGEPVEGRLSADDPTLPSGESFDRYAFAGRAGQTVAIDLSSADFDAYLSVRTPSGRWERNDDAAGSTDSRIELDLDETGEYDVCATSYAAEATGAYRLVVTDLAAARGVTTGDAPPKAEIGEPLDGQLEQGDRALTSGEFEDPYSFDVALGERLAIELVSTEFSPYLIVQPPELPQLDVDNSGPDPTKARAEVTIQPAGTLVVRVTTLRPGERGVYRLTVTRLDRLMPPTTTAPAVGRIYGVFAGISDYPEGINDLEFCAEDPAKLHNALRRAGVLAPESVVLAEQEATAEAVRDAIRRVGGACGPGDVFLFFFSGHGAQTEERPDIAEADQKDESIVLQDGEISDDEMARLLDGVRARLTILALDSCFSGGFAKDVITKPGRMGLFASEEDLTSSVADKFQAGGYLSHFLPDGLLGGADAEPADGIVTVGELCRYLEVQFRTQAGSEGAETMQGERHYQNLVVDRGGVRISAPVVAVPR